MSDGIGDEYGCFVGDLFQVQLIWSSCGKAVIVEQDG